MARAVGGSRDDGPVSAQPTDPDANLDEPAARHRWTELAEEILEAFGKHIDLVIDAPQTEGAPSTVIEVDGDTITVIREGQGSLDGLLD